MHALKVKEREREKYEKCATFYLPKMETVSSIDLYVYTCLNDTSHPNNTLYTQLSHSLSLSLHTHSVYFHYFPFSIPPVEVCMCLCYLYLACQMHSQFLWHAKPNQSIQWEFIVSAHHILSGFIFTSTLPVSAVQIKSVQINVWCHFIDSAQFQIINLWLRTGDVCCETVNSKNSSSIKLSVQNKPCLDVRSTLV